MLLLAVGQMAASADMQWFPAQAAAASARGLLGTNFGADVSACMLTFRTSSSDTSSGSSRPKDLIPTSSHAFFLLRTYDSESFRVPTRTTARPGTCRRPAGDLRAALDAGHPAAGVCPERPGAATAEHM